MTDYRRDIDGMRALAILPVVLGHFKVRGFSGGFVGVDVFFVISGFLIAGIIAREMDSGHFSFANFYERRARRILPALLVMMAFVLAGAGLLYLPSAFEDVPRSALMTLAFLANFWFFNEAGYFTSEAATQPLLHCWSLAVEEQFYLAMPLLLWAIARLAPRPRTPLLAAVGLLSFGLCLWIGSSNAEAAFYLPVTRAWELVAGALLATSARLAPRQKWLREGLAVGGIGLIAFAVLTADPEASHPGMVLLPPVLGTVLLLCCAPGTLAGRLLSMRLPVGIGLISYSLYLWHWPLIAFASYLDEDGLSQLSRGMRIALLAASLLAAWASWQFVEKPFRHAARMPRRRALALGGGALAALGLVLGALLPMGGWEARFSPEVVKIDAVSAELGTDTKGRNCLTSIIVEEQAVCQFGAEAPPTSLVWGDSHSVKLARALGDELAPQGKSLNLHTRSGCPPILEFARTEDPHCHSFNLAVFDYLSRTPSIRRVYLASFWTINSYQKPSWVSGGFISGLDATISDIRKLGKSVVIVGPVPQQPVEVAHHLSFLAQQGRLGEARSASAADYSRQAGWFTANYPRWQAGGHHHP